MNYLVFLNTRAGELERILSGMKTMLIKEFDPVQTTGHPVSPGDSLYFLRDNGECDVRVEATTVRVLYFTNSSGQDLSHTLNELQPRLQLTEDQYHYWSTKKQVLLVEFDSAHKIDVIRVALGTTTDGSDWIPFEEYSVITNEEGSYEN